MCTGMKLAALRRMTAHVVLLVVGFTFAGCENAANRALKQLERENFRFNAADFVRASIAGDEAAVDLFLAAGMDPNAPDPDGYTATMVAAENGHVRVLNTLLEKGPDVNSVGPDGLTALMLAADNNHPGAVRLLLEHGADVTLKDRNGWSALMKAVYRGYDTVLELLAPQSKEELDPALHLAALLGHEEALVILLDEGADINAPTEDGETALMMAAKKGHTDTVRLLLERGAYTEAKSNSGLTAGALAEEESFTEVAKMIAEAKSIAPVSPPPAPADVSPETAAGPDAESAGEPAEPSVSVVAGEPGTAEEEWFKKHKIDPDNPAALEQDPDGDGYSNKEEFLANTDPHDADSRPESAVVFRYIEYHEKDLPLLLEDVSGESALIKRTDSGNAAQAFQGGDSIPGLSLRVTRVRRRVITNKQGETVDVSEAHLEHAASGKKILLVKGLTAKSPESYAVITVAGSSERLTVSIEEEFECPKEEGVRYRVVDIRPTQVVIENISSGEVHTVEKPESP